MADAENFVPVRADAVFRLASLSKPITATAVMQLIEKGLLDLDAPIRRYVSAFPEKPWPVTVRQLLCHQGGVRNYNDGEMYNTRHFDSLTETLALFKDSPLTFEPGTRTLYSTYGYNLLGCAVESASGVSFTEYLREHVFKPAGMEQTRPDSAREIIPGRTRGYVKTGSGQLCNSIPTDTSNKIPGGGLCGTAVDMARFALSLENGQLLRRDSLEKMLSRQNTRDGRNTGFGLGFVVGEKGTGRRRTREAWHEGGQPQVSGVLYVRPDSRVSVVILCNLEGLAGALTDVARQIADILQRP